MSGKPNTYSMRDLWKHKNAGTTKQPFSRTIPSRDVTMFRLKLINR
ncbi:MAG: hypothetical protein R6U46_02835 [Marinilabilia sp.]